MIRLHQLVEQLGSKVAMLRVDAEEAIKFDIGDMDALPTLGDFEPAPPPFPFVYVEYFEPAAQMIIGVFARDAGNRKGFYFQYYGRVLSSITQWANPCRGAWPLAEYRGDHLYIDGVRDLEESSAGIRLIASTVAKIFTVMACSNVIFSDNRPPAALSKKRARTGKLPLFSYKTLNLKIPNTRTEAPSAGGTHASPRLHLRRGHIRKLPSGATVWVQSSVVGSKHGLIKKDYKVVPR